MMANIPEGAVALAVGTLLALVGLVFVLAPLVHSPDDKAKIMSPASLPPNSAYAVEQAIERARLRQPTCPACGPRPEPDATYCSNCGQHLV